MYRSFIKESLNTVDFRIRNKCAPEGLRYCNFKCQDYRSSDDFPVEDFHMCTNCYNSFGMAKRQLSDGKITLEQFVENPNVIEKDVQVLQSTCVCEYCKESKTFDHFEAGRRQCKACKAIVDLKRNQSGLEALISDIQILSTDYPKLTNYVKKIAKDKLVFVISHFKVGRKSSDTKDKMVLNVVNHFKRLAGIHSCTICGCTVVEQNTTCGSCERVGNKKSENAIASDVNFQDNITDFVENMSEIKMEEDYLYNLKKLAMIMRELGIVIGQSSSKTNRINMINEKIRERNIKKDYEIPVEKKLELNGILISSRDSDGFVNATQMCKAGGKKFGNWYQLEYTKELITEFGKSVDGIAATKFIDIIQGGDSKLQGSWIHPDLAVQLAQWISPKFAIQVSRWIRELAITGKVEIGQEKSQQQILKLQQDLKLQTEKHENILYKRTYHKMKKGPALYIISDTESSVKKYKVGIDGVDINVRLAQHRTTCPAIKLEYLVYTGQCKLLESTLLQKYNDNRSFQNHEWIYDVELSQIIFSTDTIISFLNIEHTKEQELE